MDESLGNFDELLRKVQKESKLEAGVKDAVYNMFAMHMKEVMENKPCPYQRTNHQGENYCHFTRLNDVFLDWMPIKCVHLGDRSVPAEGMKLSDKDEYESEAAKEFIEGMEEGALERRCVYRYDIET